MFEVARGIVCANILGIAMNPNTIAMVVAVYIPILNMHMALYIRLITHR